jgi:serine/threonine protein kinase
VHGLEWRQVWSRDEQVRSRFLNGKGSSSRRRPDSFGPFRVRADLGASRIGPVYLGHDPSTNTRVVIRTLTLSREWRELRDLSDVLNSFRRLCETTLDHPNLARPLAFGAEGKIPYVVYSGLAGTAMDGVMRQHGPRPVAEVLQRTRQLAVAIDCAAGEGLHHGMMAPCDVILERDRTGVTGLGLAQALIRAGIPAEAESRYNSPQRLAGAPPTRADDVYSIAAITLELLIGTPKDPDQELPQAQGLPERRPVQRPAPHETRVFTTIAGIDAGKLRACFAAAFSEEPSERPSTASDFVTSFEDAITNTRVTNAAAPALVADEFDSEEREDSPFAPLLDTKRAPDQEPEPIVGVESFEEEEVTPPTRTRSIDEALHDIPVRSGSPALFVAVVLAAGFAAGFSGGFIVGQRSRPSIESIHVSHRESAEPALAKTTLTIGQPQTTTHATEDPKTVASTTQTFAPVSEEKVSTVPAVQSGRLLVRSMPAGASVVVDGRSRGVTPLTLHELAFGAHRIEVSHPGQATRWLMVSLGKRHPTQSVDFDFRPTTPPADTPETDATPSTRSAPSGQAGSLHVASRPAGAQVFIDDDLIGTTPLLLSNVATGSKRLRIELPGYKSWTTSIQIEPSVRSRVSARLEP